MTFTLQQIDPLTDIVGAGLQQPEPVLWMTLYPLGIGGVVQRPGEAVRMADAERAERDGDGARSVSS